MTSHLQNATALLLAVQAERRLSFSQRPSQASDEDLDRVAAVLHAAMRPDRTDDGRALAGVIGKTVTDRWSLTSDLSERLIAFDQALHDDG